jgi:primosomal protein N' (replication factor Y) (superfamily II helicase)
MANDYLFADVILPFPLQQLYTYSVPVNLRTQIKIGIRVIVQFGQKKNYTAVIANLHSNKPDGFKVKGILSVLDEVPVVNTIQIDLWKWISEYYMCSLGEVMKAALPSGLKLESETYAKENPFFEKIEELNESELNLLELIRNHGNVRLKEISGQKFNRNIFNLLKTLYDKDAILLEESLKSGFVPKKESYVRLTSKARDENYLNNYIDKLNRAKKQQDVLFEYIKVSGIFEKSTIEEVKKKELLENSKVTSAVLQSLVKKGIFEIYVRDSSRLEDITNLKEELPVLSAAQDSALNSIKLAFQSNDSVLLHGITSSGKTEIYFHLIQDVINNGKQVLYLLPEIAITAQIINRLRVHFGNKVGIYHSKFSDNERVEIWNKLKNDAPDAYQIILGVRSSVFLPFSNLGLIIVDEEQESNFKQFDPSPRYHARDVATVLARLHEAKVLLGTATPSVETYYNAINSKYKLVELKERYKRIQLPETKVINLKAAKKNKHMRSHFSAELIDKIGDCLKLSKQVILFQNRRGYAPFIMCSECGWIPHCKYCDVTLTYHKNSNQLTCHYCGFTQEVPVKCGQCGNIELQTMGFGTEQIEEELAIYFPLARIARMDMDSTRSKHSHEKIITNFENRLIDILVGTQMITKGLDFDHVGLVGILNADILFNFPDFRAFERSFQLMIQAGGRAGRQNDRGLVIIQTYTPEHPVIRNVIKNDYIEMFNTQLEERTTFKYPPVYRLIKITVKHKKNDICVNAANILARKLKSIKVDNVLGPDIPLISRIQNMHLRDIIIKIKRETAIARLKSQISEIIKSIHEEFKSVIISVDVDPV